MRFVLKVIVTALVVAGVSELAKRSTAMGAVLASLPLTSILALIWIYWDTGDVVKISQLSHGIFWAVFPSLLFFAILPVLLKKGMSFPVALILSSAIMSAAYWKCTWVLNKLGL